MRPPLFVLTVRKYCAYKKPLYGDDETIIEQYTIDMQIFISFAFCKLISVHKFCLEIWRLQSEIVMYRYLLRLIHIIGVNPFSVTSCLKSLRASNK